jgi:hypothetical protein
MTNKQPQPEIDFVGRLVGGSVWVGESVDRQTGQPKVYKSGPSAGQPRMDFSFGVAMEKNSPYWPQIWATMGQVAKGGFPQYFDAAGNCLRPDFAWKRTDGDSTVPNSANNVPTNQEGYKGNYILWFTGTSAPKVFDRAGKPLLDQSQIQLGYYVRVIGGIGANNNPQKPGLYLNYRCVQFWQPGPIIVKGPDYGAMLSKGPGHVPTAMESGVPSASPAPMAPPAPPAPPAPAMDYVQAGPQLTDKARSAGYTYAALKGAGWSDEQMRAGNYIV